MVCYLCLFGTLPSFISNQCWLWGLNKMVTIFQSNIFISIFLNENVCILIQTFKEWCSSGTNWQDVIIGSGNGLARHRHQAITWIDGNHILWHHMASPGHTRFKLTTMNEHNWNLNKSTIIFIQENAHTFHLHWAAMLGQSLFIRLFIHWNVFIPMDIVSPYPEPALRIVWGPSQ